MLKKIKKIVLLIISPLWQYYKYLNLSTVLTIDKVSKSGVFIMGQPKGNDKLYVLKLEGQYDDFMSINFGLLKKTSRHDKYAQMKYFFIKQGEFQIGYVSTFSKLLAVEISEKMGVEICNTTETIKFLLDIYNINGYQVSNKDLDLKPSININNIEKEGLFDPFRYNFSNILKDGAYLQNKNYKMFQVVKYTDKKVIDYTKTFRENFHGVFAMDIDLSDSGADYKINEYLAYARRADKKMAPDILILNKENKDSNLDVAVVNSIIITKDEREAYNTAGSLGMEIAEKDGLDKLTILKKSFIMTREMDYDCIVPAENLNKIVGVRSRKNLTASDASKLNAGKPWVQVSVDFSGKNIYDGFVNYCFRANDNPHSVLIADSGTGKSVTVQKIISSVLRINYDESTVDRWDEVKTRYFEVGASSAQLQKMLKRLYPDEVGLIEGSVNSMRFSVTDVDTMIEDGKRIVKDDSLMLATKLLNVILAENRESPLSATENSLFGDALREIYKTNDYKSKTISELRKISNVAFAEYLEKFDEKGYNGTTRISEIDDCGDLKNLKKPTLQDVIGMLSRKSSSSDVTIQKRESYNTLILKLEAIKDLESGIYGSLNSLALSDKAFYSFEFDKIKTNPPLLRAIFSFLFVSIYEQDVRVAIEAKKAGKKMKQTMYIFEESRNFFDGNDEIAKLLMIPVLEGRKYQIHALFIAQLVEHIPEPIIKASSTFFFLMPKLPAKKTMLRNQILTFFDGKDVEYLLDNIKFRTLGIISSQGSYSCKLQLTDKELKTFSV